MQRTQPIVNLTPGRKPGIVGWRPDTPHRPPLVVAFIRDLWNIMDTSGFHSLLHVSHTENEAIAAFYS